MSKRLDVLVLSKDQNLSIEKHLETLDIQTKVLQSANIEFALQLVEEVDFDVCIFDQALHATYDGFCLQFNLKRALPDILFIVIDDAPDVERAVNYIKSGATDYIDKASMNQLSSLLSHQINTLEHQAEAILNAFMEESRDSLYVKDRQGRYILLNKAGSQFIGKSLDSILGKNDTEVFDPNAADFIMKSDRAVLMSGETSIVENLLKPINGQKRYFQAAKGVYRDPNGFIQGVIGIVRDITARHEAETALKVLENEFHTIFDVVPVMIWYKDKENKIIQVNRKTADWLGRSQAEILGQPEAQLFPPNEGAFYDYDAQVYKTGEPCLDILETRRTPDGKSFYLKTGKIPYLDEAGTIQGIIVCSTDITELIDNKVNLRKSELIQEHVLHWANLHKKVSTSLSRITEKPEFCFVLSNLVGEALKADHVYLMTLSPTGHPEKVDYEFSSEKNSILLNPQQPYPEMKALYERYYAKITDAPFLKIDNIKDFKLKQSLRLSLYKLIHYHKAFKSYLFLPILSENTVLGFMIIHCLETRVWDMAEMNYLQTIGDQASHILMRFKAQKDEQIRNYVRSYLFGSVTRKQNHLLNLLLNNPARFPTESEQRTYQKHLSLLHEMLYFLAKMENNEDFPAHDEPCFIPDMVTEISEIFAVECRERNTQIVVTQSTPINSFRYNGQYLELILFILIKFAIDNASQCKPITVSVEQKDKRQTFLGIKFDSSEAEENNKFIATYGNNNYALALHNSRQMLMELVRKLLDLQKSSVTVEISQRKKYTTFNLLLEHQPSFNLYNPEELNEMEKIALNDWIHSRLYDVLV